LDKFTLSDDQWYQIERVLPRPIKQSGGPGRPICDFVEVFEGIVWVLVSGARWKDLPFEYPSYQTCHRRFQQWAQSNVFRQLLINVVRESASKGKVALSETYIDGSFILAKRGGGLIGKSFKGRGSKLIALLDRKGVLHSMEMTSANRHDVSLVTACLSNRLTRRKPQRMIGDKAFDSDPMDRKLRAKGIILIAPDRDCKLRPTQDRRSLKRMKRRWTIERYFARIKNYRRVAIRWNRKPENYLAMVQLACLLTAFTGF